MLQSPSPWTQLLQLPRLIRQNDVMKWRKFKIMQLRKLKDWYQRCSKVTWLCSINPDCFAPARFVCTVCTCRIRWSCEGLTSISQQVLWIWLNHLLQKTMYNLSLPKLHANYYRLPTTMQLWAAHEPMLTGQCLAANWPQVLYCICLVYLWAVHTKQVFTLPLIRAI